MRPLIVGLTGGIGCGKSMICKGFARLGVPVIDTDQIARQVVSIDQPALKKLTQHFGTAILNSDRSLNRTALRKTIFKDPQQKKFVEELLHPLILEQLTRQIRDIDTPYVIVEIPLLIEANWQPYVDQILVVDLSKKLQLERLLTREESNKSDIQQIIDSQLSREERNSHADQIIDNSAAPTELSRQVSKLHQQYLKLAEMRHQ